MEFKRLSDVEVVAEPTESANVLIEENGVIKKAPKTTVGGAGVELDGIFESTEHPSYTDITSTTGFDFNAVKEKVLAGKEVVIMLHSEFVYGNTYEMWAKSVGVMYDKTNDRLMINWLAPSAYNSGSIAQFRITAVVDSSGAILEVTTSG